MATTVNAENYNISMRTNDDYRSTVDIGYAIGNGIPKMNLKKNGQNKVNDLSEYLVAGSGQSFTINIPASVIKEIDQGTYVYDCILDYGNGSKVFLFGGNATITRGVS